MRDSANNEADGGLTGEEVSLTSLGARTTMPMTEQREEGPQVCSVTPLGDGESLGPGPSIPVNAQRDKSSFQAYSGANSARRETSPGQYENHVMNTYLVVEESKGRPQAYSVISSGRGPSRGIPGLTSEQNGKDSSQVYPPGYSVTDSGVGTPINPGTSITMNEQREKEIPRAAISQGQREARAEQAKDRSDDPSTLFHVIKKLNAIQRGLTKKRNCKGFTSEFSSDDSDTEKRKSRRRRYATSDSSNDTDSYSGIEPESSSSSDDEGRKHKRSRRHRTNKTSSNNMRLSKERNRKSKSRSKSMQPSEEIDKKTLLEMFRMMQVKLPKLTGDSPEEYCSFRDT
nr:NKAP family protein UM04995-like [Penaeus vannamei]